MAGLNSVPQFLLHFWGFGLDHGPALPATVGKKKRNYQQVITTTLSLVVNTMYSKDCVEPLLTASICLIRLRIYSESLFLGGCRLKLIEDGCRVGKEKAMRH